VIMTIARDLKIYIPADEKPSTLQATLYQHFREVEPQVEITRDGRATDLQLTLDEAARPPTPAVGGHWEDREVLLPIPR
jgi:hypothetical protein